MSLACRITPSILSCDPSQFRTAVEEMIAGGCDGIHFDVMDGQFVPPITFGADLVQSLRDMTDLPFDTHLMTETPDAHFDAFIRAGSQRVAFHVETTSHAHRLAQSLRERGVEASVAINPATPVEVVWPVLDVVENVLVMTVNPGWGGQSLIESCVEKVRAIRDRAKGIEITVDGGVDPSTIRRLWDAGATTFVTGSYLMKAPSIAKGITELRSLCG
ncbi:MAG: ribulose-phosphate 3-epimerase [Fimbriimonadaceae bacterium]|nr:ribulose-phosphate 3-epimerase [Fimbriimonadaceae bacterium]